MIDRTQGDICLGPTGNLQGSYTFLSLRTRRKATHSQFKKLPTSSRITQRVTAMKIHKKKHKGLLFEGRNGVELPMIDGYGPNNDAGTAGVEFGNISSHPYL